MDLTKAINQKIDSVDERIFFDLLFECRGVVYGGFLRDTFANVHPKDIDVIIPELNSTKFDEKMNELGYIGVLNDHNDTMVWNKVGHLPVESYNIEDDPDEVMIGPVSSPDYDVNLLTFNGNETYNWIDPSKDITIIIDHIKNKVTIELSSEGEVSEERCNKILSKGYKIIHN